MLLPKFSYLRPTSLEEAVQLLDEYGMDSHLVAGGTELFPRMKYRLESPEILISLQGLQVRPPSLAPDGGLILDALMTLTAVSRSQEVHEKAPLLSDAALTVASNEIRNMGTLGGNLCQETRCLYYNQRHNFQFMEPCFKRGGDLCYFIPKGNKCWAVFMADTAPALICLSAVAGIVGPTGERQMPVEDLYSGDSKKPVTMAPGEILTYIFIPGPPQYRGSAYGKFSMRGAVEFAALSVAAVLDMKDDGKTCSGARIVVGAVSSGPLRAQNAESFLKGKELSDSLLREAAQIAADEVSVVPHHGFSGAYLKECLRIQTQRVLSSAAGRIES